MPIPPPLPPPPNDTILTQKNGGVSSTWAGWFQQLQTKLRLPKPIIATSLSTTFDFGSLAVGDRVVVIPAAAGNAHYVTVVTAGTLPEAAVPGSLYVVLRDL